MNSCACKGIRTCAVCNPNKLENTTKICLTLYFCQKLQKLVTDICDSNVECTDFHNILFGDFNGITLIKDFLSEDDKINLLKNINNCKWVESQSGRRKQDFGPKVNFKKQKINLNNFHGLPRYIEKFVNKFSLIPELRDFQPVELCNLEYDPVKGASIDSHFDDFWLWGERLVTLNIQSSTFLTFTPGNEDAFESAFKSFCSFTCPNHHDNIAKCKVEVKVPMPEGSLIIVHGSARHSWMHAVSAQDVMTTRIATTLRELSSGFSVDYRQLSEELVKVALTYNGESVQ